MMRNHTSLSIFILLGLTDDPQMQVLIFIFVCLLHTTEDNWEPVILYSDTRFIERMVVALAVLTDIMTLLCVVMSYTYIIRTITKFPSAQQKTKAFSTCSSHSIVVSITYGYCIFIYVKPSPKDDPASHKCVSVLSASVAPMLDPLIYTLRNNQVEQAFRDLIKRMSLISKK